MARFEQLTGWLPWLETLHPVEIDLGLSRVYEVATTLSLLSPPTEISHNFSGSLRYDNSSKLSASGPTISEPKVFTVAGTNGKGTCTAMLVSALIASNKTVGCYTSPHLHHYCERIAINGKPVDDVLVCEAFAAIDEARGSITLSYFEFGTLAALWIFAKHAIPYVILEVGLGGRLDAVNIVDPDIAVVTSVDIDHQEWLGFDRDSIAIEKLGIARQGRPLVIAETALTPALKAALEAYPSYCIGRDFFVSNTAGAQNQAQLESGGNDMAWSLIIDTQRHELPNTTLHHHSVAAALVALAVTQLLPIAEKLVSVIGSLSLIGRCQYQQVQGRTVIFDVAHNPAAVAALAQHLSDTPWDGETLAVIAVMADKDYITITEKMSQHVDRWLVGDIKDVSRALSATELAKVIEAQGQAVEIAETIENAFDNALIRCSEHDRIVVFGSFLTVSAIMTRAAIDIRSRD